MILVFAQGASASMGTSIVSRMRCVWRKHLVGR